MSWAEIGLGVAVGLPVGVVLAALFWPTGRS